MADGATGLNLVIVPRLAEKEVTFEQDPAQNNSLVESNARDELQKNSHVKLLSALVSVEL